MNRHIRKMEAARRLEAKIHQQSSQPEEPDQVAIELAEIRREQEDARRQEIINREAAAAYAKADAERKESR